jgi:dGTP triphosphohydrolase
MTRALVFPASDKSSSDVVSYHVHDKKDVNEISITSLQTKEKGKIVIKTMNKSEYTARTKPYRNSNYKIEENVTNISTIKKMYVATITELNPSAFDDIVNKLIGVNPIDKKSIKATLNVILLDKIDSMAKALKINRSDMIEKLLEESLVQIVSRMKNYN